MLKAVALGQLLSFLIALTGLFSSILVRQGVSLPASQSLLNYICLAVVYGGLQLFRGERGKEAVYKYTVLAAIDVLANFCLVKAYNYTTLTSVTLLDCFTVPCVLLLSWIWLKAKYGVGHWAGAFICFGGLALLISTDRAFGGETEAPRPLLGDSLVLLGAVLYAICNVAQEKLLGDVSNTELLAFLGTFGSLWGAALALITERRNLAATAWSAKVVLPILGFNGALFAFSSLVPQVLRSGGAATLNLSLLSSDLWAALARLLFFGGFSVASAISFFSAFFLVALGITVYTLSGELQSPEKKGSLQPRQGGWADFCLCDVEARSETAAYGASEGIDEPEGQILLRNEQTSACPEDEKLQADSEQSRKEMLAFKSKQEDVALEPRTRSSSSESI